MLDEHTNSLKENSANLEPQLRYGSDRKGTTSYTNNYIPPDKDLVMSLTQDEGIMNITDDFKMLGFRKKPHQNTCRQKSYDLSKTAGF